jgi:hypothetical protein
MLHSSGRRLLPGITRPRRQRLPWVLRSPAVTGNHITASSGYPREWTAYHECGHAIAYWNLGLLFEYITLSAPPRVQPLQGGTTLTVAEKWLAGTCGIISDYLHRGLIIDDGQIGILLKGGAERYELVDPHTCQVAVRPLRANAVGAGEDLEDLAKVATVEDWPVSHSARVWRECELYVKGCEPAIGAVVRRLLVVETMTSAEVSEVAGTAMESNPSPAVPEWAVRRS